MQKENDSLVVKMSGDANRWMMAFLDRVRSETSNLDMVSLSLAKDLARDLKQDGAYYFRFNLDNKVWTKGDNVGLAVSMLGASGTLTTIASLAADALSGIMRKNEVEKKKPDIVKQIWTQVRKIESSISSTISVLYAKELFRNNFSYCLSFSPIAPLKNQLHSPLCA